MLEKNIINLMYEKVNIKNLFPLVEVAANANQINLLHKEGEGSFIDNLLKYYIREDISHEINYLIEKTKAEILGSPNDRSSTFKNCVKFYANLSSSEFNSYSVEMDNNLYSILKNYSGKIINLLGLVDEENPNKNISDSLYNKVISLRLYSVADLLLAENPNCLNKKIVESYDENKMIEKMIAAGADLNQLVFNYSSGKDKKPVYSIIRSNNAKNEQIVAMIEEWANKNLDQKEVFEVNNEMYFKRLYNSGHNAESVLKSEKDWANRYNKEGISAARIALNEHINSYSKSMAFMEKLCDIQKALPALRSVDNKGENLWFDANIINKMPRSILSSYLHRVPFVMNNEGEAIFNKMDPETIKKCLFVKDVKYTKYIVEKLMKEDMPFNTVFGDFNAQEKLAERIISENLISEQNIQFFSDILNASIKADKMNEIHPKMKGVLATSNCIILQKEETNQIDEIIINSDINLNSEYLLNHPLLKNADNAKVIVSMIEAKELNQTFKSTNTTSKINQNRI